MVDFLTNKNQPLVSHRPQDKIEISYNLILNPFQDLAPDALFSLFPHDCHSPRKSQLGSATLCLSHASVGLQDAIILKHPFLPTSLV